ncbi:MAG: dihydrofolate reductase [Desulfobacterales bacterium]
MRLSLIAAVAEGGVIGRAGTIPWKVPGEQRLFRRITYGHTLIMGRKTFEDIGRPLPGRLNIVVSRNPAYRPEGCLRAESLEQALALRPQQESEVFVIGGAELFRRALPLADRIYLTEIPLKVEGDVFFPEIPGDFTLTETRAFAGPCPYTLKIYDRPPDRGRQPGTASRTPENAERSTRE